MLKPSRLFDKIQTIQEIFKYPEALDIKGITTEFVRHLNPAEAGSIIESTRTKLNMVKKLSVGLILFYFLMVI